VPKAPVIIVIAVILRSIDWGKTREIADVDDCGVSACDGGIAAWEAEAVESQILAVSPST
jgi:hypothetical protein